jgi:hypothetical protein
LLVDPTGFRELIALKRPQQHEPFPGTRIKFVMQTGLKTKNFGPVRHKGKCQKNTTNGWIQNNNITYQNVCLTSNQTWLCYLCLLCSIQPMRNSRNRQRLLMQQVLSSFPVPQLTRPCLDMSKICPKSVQIVFKSFNQLGHGWTMVNILKSPWDYGDHMGSLRFQQRDSENWLLTLEAGGGWRKLAG